MQPNKFLISSLAIVCLMTTTPLWAAETADSTIKNLAPQPTTCIKTAFSTPTAGTWYSEINIQLINNCGSAVDLQDASLTFTNNAAITSDAWGTFSGMSYPETIKVTSQALSGGKFTAAVNMHFATVPYTNTKLAAGGKILIKFGVNRAAGFDANSAFVYLPSNVAQATGTLNITNASAMPSGVTQGYAVVNLVINGSSVKSVNLPWSGSVNVTGLSVGTYTTQPQTLSDSTGNIYQGTASPASVAIVANQVSNASVSYAKIDKYGTIKVQVPILPGAIAGYTGKPTVTFTASAGTLPQELAWNATTPVTQLMNNTVYSFSTPAISYNGSKCTGTFTPATATASLAAPTTVLAFQCSTVAQAQATINVSGAPSTTSSVNVTLTPNDGSAPVVQAVTLTNGSGTASAMLTNGVVYNISTSSVSGYSGAVSPASFTASATTVSTVTYTKQAASGSGRIITFIPGWKTPPAAADLAKAGYTHAMIAFGLFDKRSPGKIFPGFDTVTAAYIAQLHSNGIKVILSLGGASSSDANATADFGEVVKMASSPTAFASTFISSVEALMQQYGFDGIDIDIEHGLGVKDSNGAGTFTSPGGEVKILAGILNQLRAKYPNMLITLTPQVANVSATAGFDNTWGNYASLITQTGPALSFVQIQLYNTGCAFGIDQICWDPNRTGSPDFAVAMATNLLADWPAKMPDGRSTGFQPYKGSQLLTPSQAGIGFPAPNSSGASDGAPVTPTATIKRAIQCMRTAVKSPTSCDTYVPPKAYPGFGTVFNWEATYDQSNGFKFATGLMSCVLQGSC